MPKQDPSQIISVGDFLLAKDRWHDFWEKELGMCPLSFPNYLGVSDLRPVKPNGKLHVRGSAARKVEMLCSENYHTLLKAYQIRRTAHGKYVRK